MFDFDAFFRQLRATLSFFWGIFMAMGTVSVVVSFLFLGIIMYNYYKKRYDV